jgi:hypothetical protein
MLDILFLLMGTVLFGMAVFFFLAMLLAVVLYFYKSNARGGLDLRKKFLELAKSCDSRKYSAIWRSSIPYDSKLKETISSLEAADKKDGAGLKKLLEELNSRLRSNVRGSLISAGVIGHTVIDIQSGLDLIRQEERVTDEGTKEGYYLVRMPGGGERKVTGKEIEAQEEAILKFGGKLHIFAYEKPKGFISIPFIYRNVQEIPLAVYPDQMDVFGDEVGLYGEGLNSFAGIQFLTGYPDREMPIVTSIIHASYASSLETVLTQVSGYIQSSSGIDAGTNKLLEHAVASHPPQTRPEK